MKKKMFSPRSVVLSCFLLSLMPCMSLWFDPAYDMFRIAFPPHYEAILGFFANSPDCSQSRGVKSKLGSLYSVFTSFFPFQTISVQVDFHFLCFTFVSIVDWMMQGWSCESHLWIILIGQSDIVKVITFLSLPNVLFTQLHTVQEPQPNLVILVNLVIKLNHVILVILMNLVIMKILVTLVTIIT